MPFYGQAQNQVACMMCNYVLTSGTPTMSEVSVFKCVYFLGEFYGLVCLVTMTSLSCHQLEACYFVVAGSLHRYPPG